MVESSLFLVPADQSLRITGLIIAGAASTCLASTCLAEGESPNLCLARLRFVYQRLLLRATVIAVRLCQPLDISSTKAVPLPAEKDQFSTCRTRPNLHRRRT